MCVSLCFVFVFVCLVFRFCVRVLKKLEAAKLQPLNSLGGRETTLTGNPEKVTTRYSKTETHTKDQRPNDQTQKRNTKHQTANRSLQLEN